MNVYYLKTALLVYPHLEEICEQIDNTVMEKALSSMSNVTPCEEQCEKIIKLHNEKLSLINLKVIIDGQVKKLTKYEKECLDYRYFKTMAKDEFTKVDTKNRQYYRDQENLLQKMTRLFNRSGFNDKWFEKNYMCFGFFKEVLACLIEREKNQVKSHRVPQTFRATLAKIKKIAS